MRKLAAIVDELKKRSHSDRVEGKTNPATVLAENLVSELEIVLRSIEAIRDIQELPDNTSDLLRQLNAEFYSGPLVHADAFRVLPLVADAIDKVKGDDGRRAIADRIAKKFSEEPSKIYDLDQTD